MFYRLRQSKSVGRMAGLIFMLAAGSVSAALECFVSLDGAHSPPFADWGTAANDIQSAVDAAGDGGTVWVTNGIYTSHTNTVLTISNGVRVVSINGPAVTVLDAENVSGRRGAVFQAGAHAAVMDGFTIRGGHPVDSLGGGMYMLAGAFINGIIEDNYSGFNRTAGGFRMSDGMVSNCVIRANQAWINSGGGYLVGGHLVDSLIEGNYFAGNPGYSGGGLYIAGAALVERCVIRDNRATSGGTAAGVWMSAGTLRNCVISGNRSRSIAGVRMSGGVIEHCTIVHNDSENTINGSGLTMLNGQVWNSIVVHNRPSALYYQDQRSTPNINISGGIVRYTLSMPAVDGDGNYDDEPFFADVAAGDFRPAIGSAAVNAGTNLPHITVDLDGAARPASGTARPDVGAYELAPAAQGAFRCGFRITPNEGMAPLETMLSAFVHGNNTNVTWYGWDIGANGVFDVAGHDQRVVTAGFPAGFHSVRLVTSNTWHQTAEWVMHDIVRGAAARLYVAPEGGHLAPYTNWMHAATNLQDAIDIGTEGSEILVADGAYLIDQELVVLAGLTLRSVNGRDHAIIRRRGGSNHRIMYVGASLAVIDGFTITNGYTSGQVGGGVLLLDGILRNSTVTGCDARNNTDSGGIHIAGGVVSDCIIAGNVAHLRGGGVRINDGLLERSIIVGNQAGVNPGYHGGGLYVGGGVVRNCLIIGNYNPGHAGGVFMGGGILENCTVVGNAVAAGRVGGGIYLGGGSVINTIVIDNIISGAGTNNIHFGGGAITYSCSPDLTHDPNVTGNITNAPGFVAQGTGHGLGYVAGNYRLDHDAACMDAGNNAGWMRDSTDLDGNPRIVKGAMHEPIPPLLWQVDIGAYEYVPPQLGSLCVIR